MRLRNQGLSLTELQRRFPTIGKSTMYYWIRDLPLTRPTKVNVVAANKANARKHRERRNEWTNEATSAAAQLVEDQRFRDFVVLFSAEGHRRAKHAVSIVNTDPAIIACSYSAMRMLSAKPIIVSVRAYADQSKAKLRKFWAERLNIDVASIVFYQKERHGLSRNSYGNEWGIARLVLYDTRALLAVRAALQIVQGGWLSTA